MSEPPFLPAHCRASRALVGLTQEDLAAAAGIARMTVKRFEAGESVRSAQAAMIRRALEDRGCVFLSDHVVGDGRRVQIGVGLADEPEKR